MLIKRLFVIAVLTMVMAQTGVAQTFMTKDIANTVVNNWLNHYAENADNEWKKENKPHIKDCHDVVVDGVTVAFYYNISPSGCIIVPAVKEMHPIDFYSTTAPYKVPNLEEYHPYNVFYYEFKDGIDTVSYTHLTLPTN